MKKISFDVQPYQPGYTAPSPPPQSEDTTIDIRQVYNIHMLSDLGIIATMEIFCLFFLSFGFSELTSGTI